MKPLYRHLLVLLVAPAALWAQRDNAECCCEASCCAPPPAREAGVAVAVDERADALTELRRLVNRYVEDVRLREQVLADVTREPQAAYRNAVLRSALFAPADAEAYAAIGRKLDC